MAVGGIFCLISIGTLEPSSNLVNLLNHQMLVAAFGLGN